MLRTKLRNFKFKNLKIGPKKTNLIIENREIPVFNFFEEVRETSAEAYMDVTKNLWYQKTLENRESIFIQ